MHQWAFPERARPGADLAGASNAQAPPRNKTAHYRHRRSSLADTAGLWVVSFVDRCLALESGTWLSALRRRRSAPIASAPVTEAPALTLTADSNSTSSPTPKAELVRVTNATKDAFCELIRSGQPFDVDDGAQGWPFKDCLCSKFGESWPQGKMKAE